LKIVTTWPNAQIIPWLQDRRVQIVLVLLLVGGVTLLPLDLPVGYEWLRTFRPAALELAAGRTPYTNPYFFNAPWALVPLLPLAALPARLGGELFFLLSMAAFIYSARWFKAKPLALTAFLLSPPVINSLINGNVDWMPLFGFTLSPQIGLLFVTMKPQIGAAVGVFWLVQAWRKGKLAEVIRVFIPVTILMLLSFALFGAWPLRFDGVYSVGVNVSLFPFSIPVGLALLVAAIRQVRIEFAMGAGPCLSPYIGLNSWVGALLGIVASEAETIAAVLGLWILTFIQMR
jgi:hypothetical protein